MCYREDDCDGEFNRGTEVSLDKWRQACLSKGPPRLANGKPRKIRRVNAYVDIRDWWVGYYRSDDAHFVCLLPCVVIRWWRR